MSDVLVQPLHELQEDVVVTVSPSVATRTGARRPLARLRCGRSGTWSRAQRR
ncbi:MAG: hypothetical protein JWN17_1363 [Frankiales bacterium]|nr:hypothetical protein [Frankiales bacterium]